MGCLNSTVPETLTSKFTKNLSKVKYGKYTRNVNPEHRPMCLKAVEHAEKCFGRPVFAIEIYQSWKIIY